MTKITNLEKHLWEMQIHSSPSISDKVAAERERLQEEKESTKQCLSIYTKAFEHLQGEVCLLVWKDSIEELWSIGAKAAIYT